jgi:FkbM family methyltransferase
VSRNDVVAQIGTPRIATVEALLRQSRPDGKVMIVEASSANYNYLRESSKGLDQRDRDRLILVRGAAYDRRCTLELELSDNFAGDNFVRIDGMEVDNKSREDGSFSKSESVEAFTLDELVLANNLVLDVLICTVNGAELAVLRGGHRDEPSSVLGS